MHTLQLSLTKAIQLAALTFALLAPSINAAGWVPLWRAVNDYGNIAKTTGVTTFDTWNAGGPYALTNIFDGTQISEVRLFVTNYGTRMSPTTTVLNPTNGPLLAIFGDYVNFAGNLIQVTASTTNTLVFTGLNPCMRYRFAGGCVRGDTSKNNRWSKASLSGVESCTPNHQQSLYSLYGILTTDNITETGILTGNEVAWNSGCNLWGDMIEWDNIDPGPDGTFEVNCTQLYLDADIASHGTYTGTFRPNGGNSYGIDAFLLEPEPEQPFGAFLNPEAVTISECDPLTLTAGVAYGIPPFTYYWYKDDMPVSETSTNSLVIPSALASDSGSYYVVVTDSSAAPDGPQMATSASANVTVLPNTTPPELLSAIGEPDGYTVTASFSKPVYFSGISAFTIVRTNGPGELLIINATLTNRTNVVLVTSTPREAFYKLVLNSGISSCTGPEATPGTSRDIEELPRPLLSFSSAWQFNQSDVELPANWMTADYVPGAGWETGTGVFYGTNNTSATTIGGLPIGTLLTLTNSIGSNKTTFYFRTGLDLPQGFDPACTFLNMRYLVDDGMIVYVNGTEVFRTSNIYETNSAFNQYLVIGNVSNPTVSTNVPLNPYNFIAGTNLIAVYLKQATFSSPDVAMGLEISVTNGCIDIWPPLSRVSVSPTNVTVTQCGTFTLSASIDVESRGVGPYRWQWFHGTGSIPGATSCTLTITNVQPSDAGNYFVSVTDSASSPTTVNSTNVPVTVIPITPVIVDNGETVTISWTANGGKVWSSVDLTNWVEGTSTNPQVINKTDHPYRFFKIR